jgi:hypothetical protein
MKQSRAFWIGAFLALVVLFSVCCDQDSAALNLGSLPKDSSCQDILPDCTAPGNDFECRDQLPECDECTSCDNCTSSSTWGPHQTITSFDNATMPTGCDSIEWQQSRLLAALNFWIDKGFNYCHHHIPGWLPPDDTQEANPRYRVTNPSDGNMTCTPNRYLDGSQHNNQNVSCASNIANCVAPDILAQIQFQGVDCSDFTSWVYNFAGLSTAGQPLNTAIGAQACDQRILKGIQQNEGVLLDINHNNFKQYQSLLQPGDLLYIMAGSKSSVPTKISHVVVWTGMTCGDIDDNTTYYKEQDGKTFGQAGDRVGGDFLSYGKVSSTTPLIVDSHFAGPAYRPFLGWYAKNLSHVRRIINADSVTNTTNPNLKKLIMRITCGKMVCSVTSSLNPPYALTYTRTAASSYRCARPSGF